MSFEENGRPVPENPLASGNSVIKSDLFNGYVCFSETGAVRLFDSDNLIVCEDASGVSAGSLLYGVEDPEWEVTYTDCNEYVVMPFAYGNSEPR